MTMKHLNPKLRSASLALTLAACCAAVRSAGGAEATLAAVASPPDAGHLRAFVELARSDLKTQKALLIAQNLPLTEEEGAEFGPLQRAYQAEFSKLNDQKLALIVRYANSYQTMTDQEAVELANGTFAIEEKKTELKRAYFKKFRKVMPAAKAARFFQIENQVNLALDLQVAASLPLMK